MGKKVFGMDLLIIVFRKAKDILATGVHKLGGSFRGCCWTDKILKYKKINIQKRET